MRTRLGLLLLIAAFVLTGCGSNEQAPSDEAPSEDWAMALCKRMVNHGQTDDAGKPVKPMAVLRARPVSVKDAAKLRASHVDDVLGFGGQTDGYLASCKVKWTEPDLVANVPLPKDAAVLVSENGDTAFVADRF